MQPEIDEIKFACCFRKEDGVTNVGRVETDSATEKAVRMWTREPLTGLHHTIIYRALAGVSRLETEIQIENRSDKSIRFSHWTTSTLAPGGRGEVTPKTQIIVDADRFVPDDRPFNDWMENMTGPPDSSPLRFVGNWKGIGDLMTSPLKKGYYAAYAHEHDEGIVRTFDLTRNPGFDIWGWGYPPIEKRQREFTAKPPSSGYIEFWNGTATGFSDDARGTIGPGESISWKEATFSVSGLIDSGDLRAAIENRVDR